MGESAKQMMKPDPRRLQVFVGKWNKEGQALDSPFGPAAKVTAVETFEWLPGELFLVHRLDGQLGKDQIACIEIIGSDASNQSYCVHSFYNDGNKNVWQLRERDGTWTLTGDWKIKGEAFKVRCISVLDDTGNIMTGKWEYSSDGSSWQLFWDTKLTRASKSPQDPPDL